MESSNAGHYVIVILNSPVTRISLSLADTKSDIEKQTMLSVLVKKLFIDQEGTTIMKINS